MDDKEDGRERFVCGNCLQIMLFGDGEKYGGKCVCEHITPNRTASILHDLLTAAGEELAKAAITRELRRKLDGGSDITVYPIPGMRVRIPADELFGNIKIDAGNLVPVGQIERAGTPVLRERIEQKRRELVRILGRETDFSVAAAVVAYTYDQKTGKYAETIVQKISGSDLKDFYLGSDALKAWRRVLYVETFRDLIIPITGDAKFEAVEKGMYYKVRISEASCPLIVACYASNFSESKLYIFL
jgi:hypothetical protein